MIVLLQFVGLEFLLCSSMGKDNWQYYGLFLSESTRNSVKNNVKLFKIFDINFNNFDKLFIDHCTLLHRSKNTPINKHILDFCEANLNKTFKIKINGIGNGDKASAYRVDLGNIPCANEVPHITIGTKNGGKPVDSNFINMWLSVDPFEIEVTLLKK